MLQTFARRLSAISSSIMGEPSVGAKEHVLFLLPFPEPTELLELFRKQNPNVEVSFRTVMFTGGFKSDGQFPDDDELFPTATILCTLTALPKPSQAPNLKYVHLISAGINHITSKPIYTDSDITITTSSGIHGPAISEWIIMQILSFAHQQKRMYQWQQEHTWGSHAPLLEMRDSVGMRLGVLGYGSIGRQAARVCKAMGMDVIAFTASARTTPESKRDHGYFPDGTGDPDGSIPSAWYSGLDKASLLKFLSQDIDILVISVPLTKETTHLLGAEEFEILGSKRNAFILNISRGPVIVQKDLVAALKKPKSEGGLRGAALDVTDPEPMEKDDELWDMDNVAITPHVSGVSSSYQTRALDILTKNIVNIRAGRHLINEVDRKKGY